MPEVLPDVELPEPPDEHRPPRLWGSGGAGGAGGAGGGDRRRLHRGAPNLLRSGSRAIQRVVPVYLLGAYIYASWESRKTASK